MRNKASTYSTSSSVCDGSFKPSSPAPTSIPQPRSSSSPQKIKKTSTLSNPRPTSAKGQISLAGLFLNTKDKNYILLHLDTEGQQHPYSTVYHEYTHLQLSKASDWLPLWLNEGLAEFFQNTDIHDKDVQLGEPSFDDLLYLRQNQSCRSPRFPRRRQFPVLP